MPSPTSISPPEALNLVATDDVRRAIEQTYANYVGKKIPFNIGYIAGAAPGDLYYGYYTPTDTYWAVATFTPSQDAIDRYHQLASDSDLNPLIFFQDALFIFSRPASGLWRFLTDTGGAICSPPLPSAMMRIWSISPSRSCANSSSSR